MNVKTKRTLRILLCMVGAVLVFVLFTVCFPLLFPLINRLGTYTKTDIKTYERFLETNSVMPRLDELGDTRDLDFKLTKYTTLAFTSTAYLLNASYDEAAYAVQKQAVLQAYEFEQETVTDGSCTIDVRFTVDGYDFGVLSLDKYHSYMPKYFYCIGTSDSEHRIAYLYFADNELDYIPSWEDFLRKDCGWD